MTSASRAQRLIDEFEEGASLDFGKGFSFRHGIAAVLRHIADTEDYTEDDMESWHGVPRRTLEGLAAALRALAVRINGADAIRQDVLDIAAELENQ